jgi:hypothetical protein
LDTHIALVCRCNLNSGYYLAPSDSAVLVEKEIKEVYQISLSTDDFLIFAERQVEEYLMTRDNLWDQGIYYTNFSGAKIYNKEGPLTEIMLNDPWKNHEFPEKSS